MDDVWVPEGWSRFVLNSRIVYSTPANPTSVRIYSRAELAIFQRNGRFLDVKEDQLVFARKRKTKEKKYETGKMNFSDDKCVTSQESETTESWEASAQREELSPFLEKNGDSEAGSNLTGEVFKVSEVNEMNVDEMQLGLFNMTEDCGPKLSSAERAKLEREQAKLSEAVSRLTIDPKRKVDHKQTLEDAAKRLTNARLFKATCSESLDVTTFKTLI